MGKVEIGGRDHAHVHLARTVLTDPADLLLLQHAQELHLHRRGHLADLVEEEGASVRRFEEPGSVLRRAGEGATGVIEELALEQRLGNGCAVQCHEQPRGPFGLVVDQPGNRFLSDTALAGYQHARIDAREAPRHDRAPTSSQ